MRPPPHTWLPKLGCLWSELSFLTLSFFFFFPLVLGSGKSGKMYTVTILLMSCSERRKDFSYSEKTLVDVWLINHAHIYAFAGVGLAGIFPFSRRKFKLQTLTRPH